MLIQLVCTITIKQHSRRLQIVNLVVTQCPTIEFVQKSTIRTNRFRLHMFCSVREGKCGTCKDNMLNCQVSFNISQNV